MCAPVSRDDDLEQTITAFDFAEAKAELFKAIEAHEAMMVRMAINGETSAQLRAAGIHSPNWVRSNLIETWIAYMATSRNACARTSGTKTDEWEMARAQDECLDRNNQNINRTAMRRVDEIEAAERALITCGRERVAAVAVSLPPYDAGAVAVAPCADLVRATEGYPYGKCGTGLPAPKRSHAAYEARFTPSSAA